jgi:hypothetical protein
VIFFAFHDILAFGSVQTRPDHTSPVFRAYASDYAPVYEAVILSATTAVHEPTVYVELPQHCALHREIGIMEHQGNNAC